MAYEVSGEVRAALSALLDNPQVQRAVAFAEADQPRCLEEHIRLTEIEAPTYEEAARAEAFAALLKAEGLEDVHIGKGGNVIGVLRGSVPGKKVLVDGHLDTVFPFGSVTKVREENGILYAPGICDDTRALAMMLSAIRALKAADIRTCRDVIFLGSTREEGSGTRSTAEAMLLKEGFDPRQFANALVAPSTESVRQMVSRGLGFSVISQAAAQDYAEFGRILIIPCGTPATRPLYLVRRKNSLLSPAARTFYDFVREVSAL